jgi:hypothetical protein
LYSAFLDAGWVGLHLCQFSEGELDGQATYTIAAQMSLLAGSELVKQLRNYGVRSVAETGVGGSGFDWGGGRDAMRILVKRLGGLLMLLRIKMIVIVFKVDIRIQTVDP